MGVTSFTIYVWFMAFVSLFLSFFWMTVNSISKQHKVKQVNLVNYPVVTVAIPAWNEEKSIISTLKCILSLDYPLDKLDIIVVDDKSEDNTSEVVKKFSSRYENIRLIKHKENKGKAGAINTAIESARGEYLWVYDADSYASRDLLKNLVLRFYEKGNKDVGAVVAITLISNQGGWIEKLQRLEYIMAAFIRKLTGAVDTLHITNALSLFKLDLIKKLGGFDEGNLTEDFEIAMRLRSNGDRIVMCEKGNFQTNVPVKIKPMWMQRVRWFRGFIYNNLKYRKMVMNKRFGLLGLFQIPLEIIVLLSVFLSVIFLGFRVILELINILSKLWITKLGFFDFTIPPFTEVFLSTNWKLLFPSLVVLASGLYLYVQAHKHVGIFKYFNYVRFAYIPFYFLIKINNYTRGCI